METYSFLRAFADSWAMLVMLVGFLGIIAWAFRPGSRNTHKDIANSIFRDHDNSPVGESPTPHRTEA